MASAQVVETSIVHLRTLITQMIFSIKVQFLPEVKSLRSKQSVGLLGIPKTVGKEISRCTGVFKISVFEIIG